MLHDAIETGLLTQAPAGDWLVVTRVLSPATSPDWANRLAEVGFIPGEHVKILTRGVPGGDPLAVRVGHSTFALRKAEADCIQVAPLRRVANAASAEGGR